jgi:hypothetical protein
MNLETLMGILSLIVVFYRVIYIGIPMALNGQIFKSFTQMV